MLIEDIPFRLLTFVEQLRQKNKRCFSRRTQGNRIAVKVLAVNDLTVLHIKKHYFVTQKEPNRIAKEPKSQGESSPFASQKLSFRNQKWCFSP